MRKITSLMATLLLMLFALPASAQVDELKYKTVSIGEAAATVTADTQWYLVWNKREYTTEGGGYWEDKGADSRAYMSAGTEVINDEDYADAKCQYLVRFISTEEEGKYLIQFGTGNYLQESMNTTASQASATYFNVYNISGNAGHFGVNVWNMGSRVDQNGSGATMATWGSGEITDIDGNNDFTIYPVELIDGSKTAFLLSQLGDLLTKYDTHLPGYGTDIFDRGTEIGQYNCSDEDYNLFVVNLQKAFDILQGEISTPSDDELIAIVENTEKGYQAIIASRVPLTIADGNYRIISAMEWTKTTRVDTGELDENDQPIYDETVTHPLKGMFADMEGYTQWADLDETDCRYLWKLTNAADGNIQMMNIATDGILDDCSQSYSAVLENESENVMAFKYIGRNADNAIVVAMKPSERGDYGYLHAGGHSNGAGTSGWVVGWDYSSNASQWILVPVSDAEVDELVEAFAPIKNHEILVQQWQETITEIETAIATAKDEQYVADRTTLITSTDQFSSPFTDPTEGGFSGVLTDDGDTYWHSSWQDGNQENHAHYFQVALAEPVTGNVQCYMHRRNNAGSDIITNLGIYGTNDESALDVTTEDGWTQIGAYDLSENAVSNGSVYSALVDYGTEGYQYLRFYIDGTTSSRGYGHFGMFQLYNVVVKGNTQWSQMGEAATTIETTLAEAKAADVEEIGIEELNDLKAALAAFKAVLCDPAALAAAIEANKNIADAVVTGENPGFWSAESEVGAIAETLKVATEYLYAGKYTQAELDAFTAAITTGAKDIFSAANPVQTDKWYAIRFDSEESYDTYGWSKGNVVNETLGDLYENYLAPAYIEENELVGYESLEDVTIGKSLRFINEDLIQAYDQVAFRFVAQGDSAYVIQHMSGLYLNGGEAGNSISLGLTPALYNVEAVGLGKVVILARNLKGQNYDEAPVYLHAQNAGHSLVTWTSKGVESNSALLIEDITEDVESESVAESTTISVKPNSMIFMTYATGFKVGEGAQLYTYEGSIDGTEEVTFAFNKVDEAQPGQPVLCVIGDVAEFDATAENDVIELYPIGTTFAAEPSTAGGFHGTYAYDWVDKGTIVVGGGSIGSFGSRLELADGEDATDCTRDIYANTGYIIYGEKKISAGDYDLSFTVAMKPGTTGDVNGDGEIDVQDIECVLQAIAAGETTGAADVNNDTEIDVQDIEAILQIIADK